MYVGNVQNLGRASTTVTKSLINKYFTLLRKMVSPNNRILFGLTFPEPDIQTNYLVYSFIALPDKKVALKFKINNVSLFKNKFESGLKIIFVFIFRNKMGIKPTTQFTRHGNLQLQQNNTLPI